MKKEIVTQIDRKLFLYRASETRAWNLQCQFVPNGLFDHLRKREIRCFVQN